MIRSVDLSADRQSVAKMCFLSNSHISEPRQTVETVKNDCPSIAKTRRLTK